MDQKLVWKILTAFLMVTNINFSAMAEVPETHMVLIKGGSFYMGAQLDIFTDALPVHQVAVDSFWMDETEVTNSAFKTFVDATGYITVAERKLSSAEFPGLSEQELMPGSVVFSPPQKVESLADFSQWWEFSYGASWRHPEGPGSSISEKMNHPVVHIAYEDALAYAKWVNKRLPTEAEWEYAARGGLDRAKYVWGNDKDGDPRFMANIYQGNFPIANSKADGYISSSPVTAFPANHFGLYGMAGNVWEWTQDWYRPDEYQRRANTKLAIKNPKGPANSFDPQEPDSKKKAIRGGSFLCTDQYCSRYMPGGRSKADITSGTSNVGFRLVKDASIL